MKLFSYEDVGAAAKYVDEIFIGCLVVSAVICVIALIVALRRETFLGRFLGIVIACSIGVGLWFFSNSVKDNNIELGEAFVHYNEAYENGEVLTVRGQVEEFTPATTSKSFTVEGVRFTIVPTQLAKPLEGTSVVMYYTYKEASQDVDLVQRPSGTYSVVTSYKPEKCVILGDNQWIEIQYIVEDGENRILYIGEISPEN